MEARFFGIGLVAALFSALVLAACRPVGEIGATKRIEVRWAERQMLFVADERVGQVRIFHTRAAPILIGTLHAPGRHAVRDLKLDVARNRLWVLGDGDVQVHDLSDWRRARRYAVPVAGAAALSVGDDGRAHLLAGDGSLLATLDDGPQVAERLPVPHG